MTRRRARSVDEYAEWVRQAVFEVEALPNFPAFPDPLDKGIEAVFDAMNDGPSLARTGSAMNQRFPRGS
jgi:hypothetical protein